MGSILVVLNLILGNHRIASLDHNVGRCEVRDPRNLCSKLCFLQHRVDIEGARMPNLSDVSTQRIDGLRAGRKLIKVPLESFYRGLHLADPSISHLSGKGRPKRFRVE